MEINFWDLPEKRNYIILDKKFRKELANKLEANTYSWKIRNKIKNNKVSIKIIKNISKREKIPLKDIEKNIIWIGGNNSKGIANPKLPISFESRSGGRFIAAIINDGTLTKKGYKSHGRLMYDNLDQKLLNSVAKDYEKIFGGSKNEIALRTKENKKYFEFSSIVRDITYNVIKKRGSKAESNLEIPNFIFKNKEAMKGWIEQTIADEGEVRFYPKKYRRTIIWKRSLDITDIAKNFPKKKRFKSLPYKLQNLIKKKKCNLIEGEKRIMDLLGIKYTIYILKTYSTSKEKTRVQIQIHLSQRKNLLKLREIINIPSERKNKKFTKLIDSYERYKEIPRIKDSIIKIGNKKEKFSSKDLKEKMNYSTLNTAKKWLNEFEKRGLIKKICEYGYGKTGRNFAKYQLI